mmetsp:Transcript_59358/g.173609  ORF Transcript_59358/g.173609 Transcript_59358/m.173609 type:complete len:207 (+) Transcript_59358:271-891(+)
MVHADLRIGHDRAIWSITDRQREAVVLESLHLSTRSLDLLAFARVVLTTQSKCFCGILTASTDGGKEEVCLAAHRERAQGAQEHLRGGRALPAHLHGGLQELDLQSAHAKVLGNLEFQGHLSELLHLEGHNCSIVSGGLGHSCAAVFHVEFPVEARQPVQAQDPAAVRGHRHLHGHRAELPAVELPQARGAQGHLRRTCPANTCSS